MTEGVPPPPLARSPRIGTRLDAAIRKEAHETIPMLEAVADSSFDLRHSSVCAAQTKKLASRSRAGDRCYRFCPKGCSRAILQLKIEFILKNTRPNMIILGLNAFHGDSAAAIVRDGKLVAAAEEERFRRIKHWAGFPSQAISYCLDEVGVALSDVGHVAVNQNSRANLFRKLGYLATQRPDLRLIVNRLKNRRARQGIGELLATNFPGNGFHGQVHRIEHHLAHLSSAFHVSPFKAAVVASIDGFGDFSSAAWGAGIGKDISIDGRSSRS
jgi:hypothetical protein